MHIRYCLILLVLLLCSGCVQPVSQMSKDIPPSPPPVPEPVQQKEGEEQYRNQLRLGLEELAQQQTGQLEQLATDAPETLWGATARKILTLHTRLQEKDSELQSLRKEGKALSRQRAALETENHELKNKLDELTKLLVELEKRHH